MSRLGRFGTLKAKHEALPREKKHEVECKQGRTIYGVEMKIVDGEGKELARDGKALGDLLVRGPWILKEYFKGAGGSHQRDGWYTTGAGAQIVPDGTMHHQDRLTVMYT